MSWSDKLSKIFMLTGVTFVVLGILVAAQDIIVSKGTLSIGTDNAAEALNVAGNIDLLNNALLNIDWAASDDGSGSGLDADTLDGIDSSAFGDATLAKQNEILSKINSLGAGKGAYTLSTRMSYLWEGDWYSCSFPSCLAGDTQLGTIDGGRWIEYADYGRTGNRLCQTVCRDN